MDIKELRRILEKNLEIINNIWRSLWHTNKRKWNKIVTKRNRKRKLLDW
jgi:hypothetical protein